MKYKHSFTMVEILLALGVCGIGICSIMVLFPIGANASRDAAMETYAANAADQMLNYLKFVITSDNNKWVNEYIQESGTHENALPESKPATELTKGLLDATAWARPASPMDSITKKNVFLYTGETSVKGVYQLISFRGDQETAVEIDSSLIDFRAIMNVWRQQIKITTASIPLGYKLGYKMAVQLNVEVSWPASLPYAARQKSLYVLEFFNPNFTP